MRALIKLSVPLVLSQFGVFLMGSVDVAMVSPLGSSAIAAAALGTFYASTVTTFAMHVMSPIEILVTRAHAAEKAEDVAAAFRNGIALSILIAIPAVLLLVYAGPAIELLVGHDKPQLVQDAIGFSRMLAWGAPGLLVYYAARLFVEGHARPNSGTAILVIGNVVNFSGNLLLIPRLGIAGSALSTSIVQSTMAMATLGFILWDARLRTAAQPARWRDVERTRMSEIARLGAPLGLRNSLREASILLMLALVESFGTAMLAGAQIAFSVFRLLGPFIGGVFWAACVLIGRESGRKDVRGVRAMLRVTIELTAALSFVGAIVMVVFAAPIARLYSDDSGVVASAADTMRVLGVLYFFVGLQTAVSAGLIAMLDMKYLAKVGILAMYAISLPLAWVLAVPLALGPTAVWCGRWASELVLTAVYLRRFQRLTVERTAAAAPVA